MTIITRTTAPRSKSDPLASVRIAVAAGRAIVTSLINRRHARRLADMPDYLLSDVGLRRDDVAAALNADWRQDPTYQLAMKAGRRRGSRQL